MDALAGQRGAARQGQHRRSERRCGSSCGPAPAASSCTRTGARRRRRSTPACTVADAAGVQVAIHTDTLNEAGFVESTLAAIGGRTIHAYHTEGAGGGHAPDIITVAAQPERAALLDQPDPAAHPQHRRRAPRHAHGLPPPEPVGSRGPGVRREPDPAVDDRRRGRPARPRRDLDDRLRLAGDGPGRRDDHPHLADRARDEAAPRRAARRRRRRQRPTTCAPAATSPSTRSARRWPTAWTREIGSVEPGKLADLVLWEPAFFGVRPHAGDQGRHDRLGADGRRERLDPDPAAACCRGRCSAPGALPRAARPALRRAGRAATPAWPIARTRGGPLVAVRDDPRPVQGRPARERRACLPSASIRTRFAVSIDGELIEPAPGRRAAHGPALLPVLMPVNHAAAAPARLAGSRPAGTPTPAGWRRRSATGRVIGRGHPGGLLPGRLWTSAALRPRSPPRPAGSVAVRRTGRGGCAGSMAGARRRAVASAAVDGGCWTPSSRRARHPRRCARRPVSSAARCDACSVGTAWPAVAA